MPVIAYKTELSSNPKVGLSTIISLQTSILLYFQFQFLSSVGSFP